MPWKQTCPMDEKIKFISLVKSDVYSFAEACRRFGISRKSGYVLLARYEREGAAGLEPRSRAPHHHRNAMEPSMIAQLLEMKGRYPKLSAGKVLDRLRMEGQTEGLPARSTVGELFKSYGLIQPRKRAAARAVQGSVLSNPSAPNALWSVDFKGHFRLGDHSRCYPLTLSDYSSRYLLLCRGLQHPSEQAVWPYMELSFRQYGLPEAIRSDNGAPFASVALGGLTRLAIWWLKLGIKLERIRPGHPEQNPRHERMHRTLKAETTRPPRGNLGAQQARFNDFRREFNEDRPHEALGQETPASVYHASPRKLPRELPRIEYPGHFEVRLVSRNCGIRWKSHRVCVTHTLSEEYVGLEEVDDGIWDVYFGPVKLGRMDERRLQIEDHKGRWVRKTMSPMSPD